MTELLTRLSHARIVLIWTKCNRRNANNCFSFNLKGLLLKLTIKVLSQISWTMLLNLLAWGTAYHII